MQIIEPSFEIISDVNSENMLKMIEAAGRTCYKSEDKITDDSSKEFVKMVMKRGHVSVIEHVGVTVRIICDRGVTHEIVRHRLASYSQECLTGDTIIKTGSSKGKTIKELFDRKNNQFGKTHNKTINIKSVDDDGIIIDNKMLDVFHKGKADVFEVKTKLGYSIKATLNHKFLCGSGKKFKYLRDISINDTIKVNGRPCLVSISDMEYVQAQTIKQNIKQCELCSSVDKLEVHHKDKNTKNNNIENLIKVCCKCHNLLHHGWYVGTKIIDDEILSIDFIGTEDVFDISMKSPFNNYIANGFVVHNSTRYCNYSKNKFGMEITFINPTFELTERDKKFLKCVEEQYMHCIERGLKPQDARYFLPQGLKTEIVMTCNVREWLHFFTLRTSLAAHPQMRQIARSMLKEFQEKIPVIFDEIKIEE